MVFISSGLNGTLCLQFVNVSPLTGKTKLVDAFLAKCVSLVNRDLLSTHFVLNAESLVVAKSDVLLMEAVRQITNI